MRLFLDANVLFSAARNPEGRAATLLTLARRGLCELLASPHAVEEARRNLNLKHPDRAAQFEQMMQTVGHVREVSSQGVAWALTQTLPPKDAPIMAAAVEAGAGLLVTGDITHFGHLYATTVRGVEVATPATTLARVLRLLQ